MRGEGVGWMRVGGAEGVEVGGEDVEVRGKGVKGAG